MREILFRGQTRRLGELVRMNGEKVPSKWAYGGICQGKGDFSIIYGSMDSELESPTEKHVIYTDTIGQYTGLTDKNGKKIFEGDICRHYSNYSGKNIYAPIVFELGMFYLKYDDKAGMPLGDMCEKIEVIGNIHDNPELLKGGAE